MENLIFAVCSTLIGGAFLFVAVRVGRTRRRLARECPQWPGTPGRITKSEVARNASGDSTTYYPSLRYEYAVSGKPYTGNRISFRNGETVRRVSSQRIVDRYPAGMQVEVFYDPKQPTVAVLDRKGPSMRGPAAGAFVGLFFAFVGVVLALSLLPQAGRLRQTLDRMRQQVTIGTRDHVGYRGSATEQDARRLGEALQANGYFTDKGAFVYLRKVKEGAFVSFEVTKGTWDNPAYVTAFEQLGRELAPVIGVYPLKIELGYEERDTGDTPGSHFEVMSTIPIGNQYLSHSGK